MRNPAGYSGDTDPPILGILTPPENRSSKKKNLTKLHFFSQTFSFEFDAVGGVYDAIKNGIRNGWFPNHIKPTGYRDL
jgi:hypothetical protein